MIFDYPYLNNQTFLQKFDLQNLKEYYVTFTLLDWAENELKDVTGKVIGGSMNKDGDSSMRRTANIQVAISEEDENYNNLESDFAINKKLDLKIGIRNLTDRYVEYPIIWFPQGIFVIANASISHSTSGTSVSLQLQDKMCLLNGQCGGMFSETAELDTYEEDFDVTTGTNKIVKIPIYDLIYELVNHYGGEQLSKIIISDVPKRIKQVMKWSGDAPIYISNQAYDSTNHGQISIQLQKPNTDQMQSDSNPYGFIEYSYGEDVGYQFTDYVYPTELIVDAGSTVCDALDQIKNVLGGNYEYFYDIKGNFIFQEIKNYLNTTQATSDIEKLNSQKDYLVDMGKGKSVYNFSNNVLIQSYNNSPQYMNIKNDFLVWGVRKSVTGQELPIRYHLAIDKKPTVGTTRRVVLFEDGNGDPRCKVTDESITIKDKTYNPQNVTSTDWRTELYLQGAEAEDTGSDPGYYYKELLAEWQKLYDISAGKWKCDLAKDGASIDYYLDFIDTTAALGEYSVQNIGRRTEVISDNSINCVFEPSVPDVCIINVDSESKQDEIAECIAKNQKYCIVDSEIYDAVVLGGMYNSAFNTIKDLLYQRTNYNESISLTAVPIYYLEPNTRITVQDTVSGIAGDFMIKTISLPFSYNGTMTISANKVLTKI